MFPNSQMKSRLSSLSPIHSASTNNNEPNRSPSCRPTSTQTPEPS